MVSAVPCRDGLGFSGVWEGAFAEQIWQVSAFRRKQAPSQ